MANIFSGLESLGLGNLSGLEIFSDEEAKKKQETGAVAAPVVIREEDLVYEKSYKCPCCDKQFTSKVVKTGKNKLRKSDSDLRPVYESVDSTKYDTVVCPRCGYGCMTKYFAPLSSLQCKLIKEAISKTFKGLPEYGPVYSYQEAMARYKLALVSTVVKKGKSSEKAYCGLKLSWLARSFAESLSDSPADTKLKAMLAEEEKEYEKIAFAGFKDGFSKENFPMAGMDEYTVTYLVGELARRLGLYDEASRNISRVITAPGANEALKNRARDVKEMLVAEMKKAAEK